MSGERFMDGGEKMLFSAGTSSSTLTSRAILSGESPMSGREEVILATVAMAKKIVVTVQGSNRC